MAVMLRNPCFSDVPRRSRASSTGALLTGRWGVINSDGEVAYPGSAAGDNIKGVYLILEGDLIHVGDNTDFAVSTYVSTDYKKLPQADAAGEVALAFGSFVYDVGPEGCDPAETFTVGDRVTVDAYGRIAALATSSNDGIASVEAVETDSNGVTKLTLRTFGV